MSSIQLNIYEAQKERDKGIAKAIDSACKVDKDWPDKAYKNLKEFLNIQVGEFQAEEIRSFAAMDDDFPQPKSERAWGGVIVRAIHENKIIKVGVRSVKNKKARCANANVYVKA